MTAPKKGDRVRVTYEGVVKSVWSNGACVVQVPCRSDRHDPSIEHDGGHDHISSPYIGVVEVLEPAPPAWWPLRDGDVFRLDVVDESPICFVTAGRVVSASYCEPVTVNAYQSGECTLLFRDGKPYVEGGQS